MLKRLRVVPLADAQASARAVDGAWWDSGRRIPDWMLVKRRRMRHGPLLRPWTLEVASPGAKGPVEPIAACRDVGPAVGPARRGRLRGGAFRDLATVEFEVGDAMAAAGIPFPPREPPRDPGRLPGRDRRRPPGERGGLRRRSGSPVVARRGFGGAAARRPPEWDVAVWLDILTFPGTPDSNRLPATPTGLRRLQRLVCGGARGVVEGWGYTAEAAWANPAVVGTLVPDSFRAGPDPTWDWAIQTLDAYDPARVFSNDFLDSLT